MESPHVRLQSIPSEPSAFEAQIIRPFIAPVIYLALQSVASDVYFCMNSLLHGASLAGKPVGINNPIIIESGESEPLDMIGIPLDEWLWVWKFA